MYKKKSAHKVWSKAAKAALGLAVICGAGIHGSPQAVAQEATSDIVVLRLGDGDKVFKTSQVKQLEFGTDGVRLVDADNAGTFVDYDALVSVRFNTVLGVSEISADKADAAIEFDGVSVRASLPLDIYDVCGRKVLAAPSGMADVTTLPTGLYIVRAGVQTLKISKK